MTGPMDVVLYLGTPAVLLLAGYSMWLAHRVKRWDALHRDAPHVPAHHPAE